MGKKQKDIASENEVLKERIIAGGSLFQFRSNSRTEGRDPALQHFSTTGRKGRRADWSHRGLSGQTRE